ncbi:MAG: HigA family addiction module antidote protein [Treponema sp.]|jgi:addiction module HigA family antidote|nr:HigA family addiction module antidote protein [Treponema sp.]
MSNTYNNFVPDYVVTPGEVLNEYLEDAVMTQAELADRTGLAKKTINEIINDKSPITPETALKLERTLGRPACFWSSLERQRQDDKARIAERKHMESYLQWLDNIPVANMAKLGWIRKLKDKVEQLEEVLRFFGIASPEQWDAVWSNNLGVVYRQTQKQDKRIEIISAWLRRGEIEAQNAQCALYNRKVFQDILDKIRGLTREKDPEVFVPNLIDLCASVGVLVIFVPALTNLGIYGATRWIGNKPVIQLSLYLKSNDHLWFTFFHEAGHILLHGRRGVFLEGSQLDNKKEDEADTFAQDKLIPPVHLQRLIQNGKPSLADIERFAESINIAPGVVVGRLQWSKILPRDTGNHLKVFYHW